VAEGVSRAEFDASDMAFSAGLKKWLDSLGEIRAARFFVLPDDVVRYEIAAGGQYRAASLTADRLWRVVDDAGAPAATRAGAAMVLAGDAADADVRQRLRVSAEACADPKLRVALQSVASDDVEDEALLEAMKPLVERAG